MHVAAANPLYIDIAAVPPAALERERAVLREQALASAKSEAIVERMVEGRLRKFYEEVVLLEQIFVIDGERRVGKVIEAAAKEAGAPIRVAGFVRFRPRRGHRAAAVRFRRRGRRPAQELSRLVFPLALLRSHNGGERSAKSDGPAARGLV